MPSMPLPTRRRARVVCVYVALTALVCAGVLSVAVLAGAPPLALPFIAAICIGCPIMASWDLPMAIAVLRAMRRKDNAIDWRAVAAFRRNLDQLPETQHPLGL